MAMIEATWTSVECLGIPDSPMRTVLFELARFMDDNRDGDEWVLASAGYMAMWKEFQEQFTPKSPLQSQVDHLKVVRELEEMTGIRIPEIPGDQFALRLTPETVDDLAIELGYASDIAMVRNLLSQRFPEHANNSQLHFVSKKQVNYVRAHLVQRV